MMLYTNILNCKLSMICHNVPFKFKNEFLIPIKFHSMFACSCFEKNYLFNIIPSM